MEEFKSAFTFLGSGFGVVLVFLKIVDYWNKKAVIRIVLKSPEYLPFLNGDHDGPGISCDAEILNHGLEDATLVNVELILNGSNQVHTPKKIPVVAISMVVGKGIRPKLGMMEELVVKLPIKHKSKATMKLRFFPDVLPSNHVGDLKGKLKFSFINHGTVSKKITFIEGDPVTP